MIRFLSVVLELALLVYCLIDCIQTDEARVRNLPKIGWILLIIIVPIVGGLAWLFAGRPRGGVATNPFGPAAGRQAPGGRSRPGPVAPEDDPNFMRKLDRGDPEKERLLQQWEADLKRREEQLRKPTDAPPRDGAPTDTPTDGTDSPA